MGKVASEFRNSIPNSIEVFIDGNLGQMCVSIVNHTNTMKVFQNLEKLLEFAIIRTKIDQNGSETTL